MEIKIYVKEELSHGLKKCIWCGERISVGDKYVLLNNWSWRDTPKLHIHCAEQFAESILMKVKNGHSRHPLGGTSGELGEIR
jgi:hypothetical protein